MYATTCLHLALAAILITQVAIVASTPYTLVADYSGSTFFNAFTTFTDADPTHGNVHYLDLPTAAEQKLVGFIFNETSNATHAYIGVDYTSITPNRNSVRLTSKQTFDVGMLAVFDIYHMPAALGTWPAVWMLGDVGDGEWPANGGEVDIVESVNGVPNAVTLHTAPGCTVDNASSAFQGTLQNLNCNAGNGYDGCSITTTSQNVTRGHGLATAGQAFNDQGGAVYVFSWTMEGVSVWMFAHGELPSDLVAGAPDPSSWTSKPLAKFTGSGCDFIESLSTMQIVVDTTFCGDWAGKVWESMGLERETGYKTCAGYVQEKPEAFREAYFELGSVRVYSGGSLPGLTSTTKRDVVSAGEIEFAKVDVRERYEEANVTEHDEHHHHHGMQHDS